MIAKITLLGPIYETPPRFPPLFTEHDCGRYATLDDVSHALGVHLRELKKVHPWASRAEITVAVSLGEWEQWASPR